MSEREPVLAAEGPAGNVVIWEGRTWHATGENVTNQPRYGMVTLYCGPQFRTLDNFTLGIRPEVYADASPELLALIGFEPWNGCGQRRWGCRCGSWREKIVGIWAMSSNWQVLPRTASCQRKMKHEFEVACTCLLCPFLTRGR